MANDTCKRSTSPLVDTVFVRMDGSSSSVGLYRQSATDVRSI